MSNATRVILNIAVDVENTERTTDVGKEPHLSFFTSDAARDAGIYDNMKFEILNPHELEGFTAGFKRGYGLKFVKGIKAPAKANNTSVAMTELVTAYSSGKLDKEAFLEGLAVLKGVPETAAPTNGAAKAPVAPTSSQMVAEAPAAPSKFDAFAKEHELDSEQWAAYFSQTIANHGGIKNAIESIKDNINAWLVGREASTLSGPEAISLKSYLKKFTH